MEQRVMHTTPRPVRSAHFLTETIGVAKDGPAILYLDTVNKKNNFWGSSIMDSHIDVKKSAEKNNFTKVEAHVQGISLSSLLNKTVDSNTKHVFIKMDIEGAEYEVMNEAHDTICQTIASGVKIDILLELHPPKIVGQKFEPRTIFNERTEKSLKECGLVMNNGRYVGG